MHQRYDTHIKEVNILKTGVKKIFLNLLQLPYIEKTIEGPNHSKGFFNTCMM